MKQIIINQHYCTREEWEMLKNFLTEKCWDWYESDEEVD